MRRIVFKYIGFLVGITILTFVLSRILNISTENTWLGFVYANVLWVAIIKMIWDISKHVRKEHPFASRLLGFVSAFVAAGLILVNVVAFMDLRGLLP